MLVNVRCSAKKNTKRGMTMYAGIFMGNYAKNMTSKEHNNGTSMTQIELLRTKDTRFSVIPRLRLDEKILFLLIKPRRKLISKMLPYLEMNE